jgi:outer membrane lipopolysaccharide assembly protein LptE/RlpB
LETIPEAKRSGIETHRENTFMMKKIIKITTICISCAVLFGCGYSFAPRGENIDKRIQKVYVESFDNRTAEAGIENYVRTAFINQFIQNSRLKIVESAESADAIVKGKILNLHTSPLSYRSNALVAEERVTIILELTFLEYESGKIIWSSNNITDTFDYTLSDDINLLPAIKKDAFIKLANDIAEKAFNLMMAGF